MWGRLLTNACSGLLTRSTNSNRNVDSKTICRKVVLGAQPLKRVVSSIKNRYCKITNKWVTFLKTVFKWFLRFEKSDISKTKKNIKTELYGQRFIGILVIKVYKKTIQKHILKTVISYFEKQVWNNMKNNTQKPKNIKTISRQFWKCLSYILIVVRQAANKRLQWIVNALHLF